MDKAVLKKFAIESRQDLMQRMENKIKAFYIDEKFSKQQSGDVYILANSKHSLNLSKEEYTKRELLIKRIDELGLDQVIEETAYTWFNRIIAIRYMEIHDYLPLTKDNQSLGIRVLSSKDNTTDPEIMKFTNLINPELDINFKKEKYVELKDDNEKFKYILLLVCRKLGRVIPQVFDGVTDYIDILVPDNLLNESGFINKIVTEVPVENYEQVEIIGWLYQYYNQTEKDRVISSKKTYKKNEIPYATQLFTPDWIVKYMVENTLGKYWIEHNENDELCDNWKYFIKDNIENNGDKLNPTDITFIDPCCGSGHILVYAFEVFYQIYLEAGYNKSEIPELILKNNLYGLDIDDRAGQLSVLSVILKAREYDKNIFNKEIVWKLNIMSIQESNLISDVLLDNIQSENNKEYAKYLIDTFKNAKEIGSLLILNNNNYTNLKQELIDDNTIFGIELRKKLLPIIQIANILMNKYDIVVTNPPYMNNSVMSVHLKDYIVENYDSVKSDVFSSFILRNYNFGKSNAYLGFMTPYVWMFISSYEDLRKFIIDNTNIETFIQMEYSALEEATVPICSFVLNNDKKNNDGVFFDLSEFTGGMKVQEEYFIKAINEKVNYKYYRKTDLFNSMNGKQLAFQNDEKLFGLFKNTAKLSEFAIPKCGLKTGITEKYVKNWFEVDFNDIGFNIKSREDSAKSEKKWFPASNGGEYRKWYGNQNDVVWWYDDGYEIRNLYNPNGKLKSRPQNMQYYFKEGITWSALTSKKLSLRITNQGNIITGAGYGLFNEKVSLLPIMGILNSIVIERLVKSLSQTLNFEVGVLEQIPIILSDNDNVEKVVKENIQIEKDDWDSFETSWNFTKHPLLKSMSKVSNIRDSLANWNTYTYQQRSELKHNEEELNKIFIDIYGLNDELTPTVDDKDITIRKEDNIRDIKSFISYAVGCMFGRYSLDKNGLIYAGGDFDKVYQKCKKADGGWAGSSISNYKYLNDNGNEIELSFEVDNDNIIPITDEAYFSDDIVERFKTFIKTVYGDNTFNENMDFIAETLGKKEIETSEETIRRYFVNDFFNDHCKIYQKRPIYWLLDSGKKNGFKALIYMHRYNENLIPKARLDYLHRIQTTYEKLLSDVNYKLTTNLSMVDKKDAQKRQADLNAKLQEIKEYDEKIAHIANQRISIDLDDGVKVNYEKFKDILGRIK